VASRPGDRAVRAGHRVYRVAWWYRTWLTSWRDLLASPAYRKLRADGRALAAAVLARDAPPRPQRAMTGQQALLALQANQEDPWADEE
jgi:hypothetical protein